MVCKIGFVTPSANHVKGPPANANQHNFIGRQYWALETKCNMEIKVNFETKIETKIEIDFEPKRNTEPEIAIIKNFEAKRSTELESEIEPNLETKQQNQK